MPKPLTIPALRARKSGEKIVMLTAYTAPVARLLDAHVDALLVGDSLGMTVYGMPSTLPVTLELMIAHGRAVASAAHIACVIVDLPFGSYQASPAQAFETSARVIAETGCAAVKLEGGAEMAETIAFLTARGIPVCAHIGLMPQRVQAYGGYRVQGRHDAEAVKRDALAIEAAGAFAVVLEAIPEPLARDITASLAIPTIGIGASPACDGQVLVIDDLLGLNPAPARFVKAYADLNGLIETAARAFAADVRSGTFPGPEHCYSRFN